MVLTRGYWNAFVAVLALRGLGTFFDERLDNTNKWPIAATFRFGHTSIDNPDHDLVTSKLPALQVFQLSIPAVAAQQGPSGLPIQRSTLVWEQRRNQERRRIDWKFTRQDADRKLSRHYVT